MLIRRGLATGGNPDAIFYERAHEEVYTFNGSGHSATVFSAATGQKVTTSELGRKPEAASAGGVWLGDDGEVAARFASAQRVDAAVQVRTLGHGDSRGCDVADDLTGFPDVDFLTGLD